MIAVLLLHVAMGDEPCELLDVPFASRGDAGDDASRRFLLASAPDGPILRFAWRTQTGVETAACTPNGPGFRCGAITLVPAERCGVDVADAGATVGTFFAARGAAPLVWTDCHAPGADLAVDGTGPRAYGSRTTVRYIGPIRPASGCTGTFEVYENYERIAAKIPDPASGSPVFDVDLYTSGRRVLHLIRRQTCAGSAQEEIATACAVVDVAPAPQPVLVGAAARVYSEGIAYGRDGVGPVGTAGGSLGALERSLIDDVVKQHMNKIRFCYQRALPATPTLAGKIVVRFVIGRDGLVTSASIKQTTMNRPDVESCIVGRFLRMEFPKPKGNGIVNVSYPFIFAPR